MPNEFGMGDNVDWCALARYVAGECPPEEREQVEQLLEEDGELRDLVYIIERTWHSRRRPPRAPDAEDSWGRMKRRMDVAPEAQPDDVFPPKRILEAHAGRGPREPDARNREARKRMTLRKRAVQRWPAGIAAVAVVLLTFIAVDYSTSSSPPTEEVVQMREVTTEPGQRATFTLGDGTKIVLNADSRIRVPDNFEDEQRDVFLEGEAYFEVAHDESRPFVVQAENGRVEVLGTTFALRSYGDDVSAQVVVVEGRVAFSADDGEVDRRVVLERGQRARLSADGGLATDEVEVTKYISWIDGRLVFDETPLDEVAVTLERWYDVDVHIEDEELRHRIVTADLKGKYLLDVLDVLAMTADVRYELNDDKLHLRK